jgi:ribosomal protein S18 acetylase RimI-like enzyme
MDGRYGVEAAVRVRPARLEDEAALTDVAAGFRVALAELRGRGRPPDLVAAGRELADYGVAGHPIFVAEAEDGELVGYLVCRIEDNVVWAESLYVVPEWRRMGVGSALYHEAEWLAGALSSDTVYNWVHPDNDGVIAFLQKRGYQVLNLIELRRARFAEEPAGHIRVGAHEFEY